MEWDLLFVQFDYTLNKVLFFHNILKVLGPNIGLSINTCLDFSELSYLSITVNAGPYLDKVFVLVEGRIFSATLLRHGFDLKQMFRSRISLITSSSC